MNGKRSIEVTVSPSGEITIDAVGFKGADCEQATRYLEEALGVVGTKSKKPEYHQKRTNTQQQRLGS
ncbi:MAG: DUF2997 domain-containing protein [Verrucomicrobiaceae bacterium]|nr:MAG: DUF2997 domain-containing protein [Verrucomicrobiaceae bacterium]